MCVRDCVETVTLNLLLFLIIFALPGIVRTGVPVQSIASVKFMTLVDKCKIHKVVPLVNNKDQRDGQKLHRCIHTYFNGP